MRLLILLAFTFSLLNCPRAWPASFTCDNLSTEVEHIVCGYDDISGLDDELTKLYGQARAVRGNPKGFLNSQRNWLKNVRDKCNGYDCVESAYRKRIFQLDIVIYANQKDRSACSELVSKSNSGELLKLKAAVKFDDVESREVENIFNENTFENYVSYAQIDMNGDGVIDHIAMWTSGTAREGEALVKSGISTNRSSWVLGDGDDLLLLKIGANFYILSSNEEYLHSLWKLSDQGEMVPVCSFSESGKPHSILKAGTNQSLCKNSNFTQDSVIEEFIRHSRYESRVDAGENARWTGHIDSAPLQFDIDNDGKQDFVVQAYVAFGGGRGCDYTFLAVSDDSGTKVEKSNLNKTLAESALMCRGGSGSVFSHDGINYVNYLRPNGDRRILLINSEKTEAVCEFEGRVQHAVNPLW